MRCCKVSPRRNNKRKIYVKKRTFSRPFRPLTKVKSAVFYAKKLQKNVNDVKPYISRLKYQIETFGFNVKAVGLDAGYNTSAMCKALLEDFKIQAATGKRRGCQQKGKYGKYKFAYITEWDV